MAYWAEVPLDVEVLRASKLDTIKSVYESQRNYGVAEYQGMSFSIHETAKQNLTARYFWRRRWAVILIIARQTGLRIRLHWKSLSQSSKSLAKPSKLWNLSFISLNARLKVQPQLKS